MHVFQVPLARYVVAFDQKSATWKEISFVSCVYHSNVATLSPARRANSIVAHSFSTIFEKVGDWYLMMWLQEFARTPSSSFGCPLCILSATGSFAWTPDTRTGPFEPSPRITSCSVFSSIM